MPKKRSVRSGNKDKQSGMNDYTLDDVDHKLLRHIMEYPKDSFDALGKVVGLSKTAVHFRYKKPAFQKALQDLRAETWEIIKKAQNAAARTLMNLAVKASDERVRLDAAKTLLAPLLNKGEITINQYQEIIHRTRFGEQGQIISDSVKVEKDTPSNTLELMEGIVDADIEVPNPDDKPTVPSRSGSGSDDSGSGS